MGLNHIRFPFLLIQGYSKLATIVGVLKKWNPGENYFSSEMKLMQGRLTALFVGFELYQLVMVGLKLKVLMITTVVVFFLHVTVIQRLLRCNITPLLTQLVSCKPVHVSWLKQTKGGWYTVVIYQCFGIYWLFVMFSSCHFLSLGLFHTGFQWRTYSAKKGEKMKRHEISPEEISFPYFERLEQLRQILLNFLGGTQRRFPPKYFEKSF